MAIILSQYNIVVVCVGLAGNGQVYSVVLSLNPHPAINVLPY